MTNIKFDDEKDNLLSSVVSLILSCNGFADTEMLKLTAEKIIDEVKKAVVITVAK